MHTPLSRGAFRTRLQNQETTYGTFLGLGSPMAAEVVGTTGVDWVLVDLEHGGGTESQLGDTVVAAGAYGVPALVRVESQERIRIGRALDAGAAGIMIPRIDNISEAQQAVTHMSYPPHGDRGVATYNRSARWGGDVSALDSGRDAACIIQIESLGGLESAEEIAALEGVDCLFIGPQDLTFSLGIPREFTHPTFLEACHKVLKACERSKKVAGILASDAPTAIEYKKMGFGFIAIASDAIILARALSADIEEARKN